MAVYRDVLLPFSQTFVATQASTMPSAQVLMFGTRRDSEGIRLLMESFTVEELMASGQRSKARRTDFAVARFKIGMRCRPAELRLRQFEPQVLVAHFASDGLRVLPLARKLGVPLVVFLHGSDVMQSRTAALQSHYGARRLARRWPMLARRADLFVCQSETVSQAARARGISPHKVVVMPIGVVVPPLDVAVAVAGHQASNRVLFVGRLSPEKGVAHLLQAFSLAVHAGINSELDVVGDGVEREKLEEIAAGLGIENLVTWHGILSQEAVSEMMRRARVLVVPSVPLSTGVSEGLGMVAIEAQCMALPVVAFATGGLREVIDNEDPGGVLVYPRTPQALSEQLGRVLSDDALVAQLGAAGHRTSRKHFDADVCGRRIEETLRSVADNHANSD